MSNSICDLGLGHVNIYPPVNGYTTPLARKYQSRYGLDSLRELIAGYEQVNKDEVTVTSGASMGLICSFASLKKTTSILCPRPYYPAYPFMINSFGLQPLFYDLKESNGWVHDLDNISDLCQDNTSAILINYPHNPTGAIPSENEMHRLIDFAHQKKLIIISDEVYTEFATDNLYIKSILANSNNCIRIKSFSKSGGIPGERLGYILSDVGKIDQLAKIHWNFAMSSSANAQNLAISFLHQDPSSKIKTLSNQVKENLEHAISVLKENPHFKIQQPKGGVFLWIGCKKTKIKSSEIVKIIKDDLGIIVHPGTAFGVDDHPFFRISVGTQQDVLHEALERLVAWKL